MSEPYSQRHARLFAELPHGIYVSTDNIRPGDEFVSFDDDGTPNFTKVAKVEKSPKPGITIIHRENRNRPWTMSPGAMPVRRVPQPEENTSQWETLPNGNPKIEAYPELVKAIRALDYRSLEEQGCTNLIISSIWDFPRKWYRFYFVYNQERFWVNLTIRINTPYGPDDGNPYLDFHEPYVEHGKEHLKTYQPLPW